MRCTTPATQIGLGVEALQPGVSLFELCNGLGSKPQAYVDDVGLKSSLEISLTNASLSTPAVEVRPSPGRGLGLFAVTPVAAYTKILEDDALISLAHGEDLPELWLKYKHLPPQQKQVFDELNLSPHLVSREKTIISVLEQRGHESLEARKMAEANSRWQSNAFKTEASSVDSSHPWAYALFGTVARINHSCTPNASADYQLSGSQVVYALRDIEADDEIEIAYFDITMPKSDRQTRSRSWGFQCSCPACSGGALFAGSTYEERIAYVHQHITLESYILDLQKQIDATQAAVSIACSPEYPWLVNALPRLYSALFNLQMRSQLPREKVREALVKALQYQIKLSGRRGLHTERMAMTLREFDARN